MQFPRLVYKSADKYQLAADIETFDSLARGRPPSLQSQNDVHDISHVRHHSDIGMQPSHMHVDP